jgi:L-ascorbate metabolism protein UlaG (beta-lactamase superfamily)
MGLMTLGPRRLVAPSISIRQLPKLDLILISHAHFDHLDRPSLSRLSKKTPVITAHRTHDLVHDLGFKNVTELQWGESLRLGNVNVTRDRSATGVARNFLRSSSRLQRLPARIEQAPRPLRAATPRTTSAFAISQPSAARGIDLAILGIGAYDPYIAAHATPEQAWQMADHCMADHVLPMHHSTFRLSHEPTTKPLERLMEAAGAVGWIAWSRRRWEKSGRWDEATPRLLSTLRRRQPFRSQTAPTHPRHGLLGSFSFALAGIAYLFRTQRNARIHGAIAVIVCLLAAWLRVTRDRVGHSRAERSPAC